MYESSQQHYPNPYFSYYPMYPMSQLGHPVPIHSPPPPPPTPAETLKLLLAPSKSAAAVAPPLKKSVIYQTFRPPLKVVDAKKIACIGDTVLTYKEVADPAAPETKYMLCGECESTKLYRAVVSLAKHRKLCHKEPPAPVCTIIDSQCSLSPGDPVDAVLAEARMYFCSLSREEVIREIQKFGSSSADLLQTTHSTSELVEMLIDLTLTLVGGDGPPDVLVDPIVVDLEVTEEPSPLVDENEASLIPETTCVTFVASSVPPLPTMPLPMMAKAFQEKAGRLRTQFPGISDFLLAIALVGDLQISSVETTMTDVPKTQPTNIRLFWKKDPTKLLVRPVLEEHGRQAISKVSGPLKKTVRKVGRPPRSQLNQTQVRQTQQQVLQPVKSRSRVAVVTPPSSPVSAHTRTTSKPKRRERRSHRLAVQRRK